MSTSVSPRPRALLSVYDKTGIVEFATALSSLGFELASTGGTARKLREAGLEVICVSDITGHPEIFDGRVKSLHPAIHGPLLARLETEADREGLAELGYPPIQIVACNLYPFQMLLATSPRLMICRFWKWLILADQRWFEHQQRITGMSSLLPTPQGTLPLFPLSRMQAEQVE